MTSPDSFQRYHRQMLLPGIGEAGQHRLQKSHALVVGCGALGTVIADALARAGVGTLTIVDRDLVELTNLQRQVLFDERDVAEGAPKAVAAAEKIGRINSQVRVCPVVEDFNHTNAEHLSREADVVMDGLDNFQTRYLLNDLSVKHRKPYFYGGAVGTTGMSCAFIPKTDTSSTDEPPCLRCVFPDAPPPGTSPTCDTAGVLASAVSHIAHFQVTQALKFLTGNAEAIDLRLLTIDIWQNEWRVLDISGARSAECPCCGNGRFDFLDARAGSSALSLCGRGAVQINPRAEGSSSRSTTKLDLKRLAERLSDHGQFRVNEFLLRGTLRGEAGDEGQPLELTIFADGRAIVAGTARTDLARTIYDRYVGG